VVVPDDLPRDSVELSIPDLAAIAELGRQDSEKRIAIRWGERFRQPEYCIELRIAETDKWHWTLRACATRMAAR
jgi:hypothetical protein